MLKSNAVPARRRVAGICFAAVLASAAGLAYAQGETEDKAPPRAAASAERETPEAAIEKWPKAVKAEAKILIERYGRPNSFDENELVWNDNGPWVKSVLRREGLTPAMMGRSKDHLRQTVRYQVPADKVAELERFDKRLEVDREAGELSSRADSESMNFLALNLADDIIKGQRTAADARAFSVKVKMLEKAGKDSPYLGGFIFALKDEKAPETETTAPEKTPSPEEPRGKMEAPPTYDDAPNP